MFVFFIIILGEIVVKKDVAGSKGIMSSAVIKTLKRQEQFLVTSAGGTKRSELLTRGSAVNEVSLEGE